MSAATPGPGPAEHDLIAPAGQPAPQLPPPPARDRTATRARAVGQGSLVVAGLGAVLLAGRAVSIPGPACPFRAATGLPCPGCGMTRLADAVAHARFTEALTADPAGVALLGVIAVLAVVYLVRSVIPKRPAPRWMGSPVLLGGIVAVVAVHWGTTLITGTLPAS